MCVLYVLCVVRMCVVCYTVCVLCVVCAVSGSAYACLGEMQKQVDVCTCAPLHTCPHLHTHTPLVVVIAMHSGIIDSAHIHHKVTGLQQL